MVPTEVWADTSAQLDCESAPAFGRPQNAVGPCHLFLASPALFLEPQLLPFYLDGSSLTLPVRCFQDPRRGLCSLGCMHCVFLPWSCRAVLWAVLRPWCPLPSHAFFTVTPLGMPSFRPQPPKTFHLVQCSTAVWRGEAASPLQQCCPVAFPQGGLPLLG